MNAPIYKYYLDGVRFDDPAGWEKLDKVIRRDESLRGTLTTTEVSLEFTGAAHDYLWRKRRDLGMQAICTIEIYEDRSTVGDYDLKYTGLINISDIEFDRSKLSAKVKPQDNGYYSSLNNNKSIEVDITASESKNGLSIAAPTVYQLRCFNPCTGHYDTTSYRIWRMEDALKHLISFLTDGAMDVSCPPLEDGGMWSGLAITNGWNISQLYYTSNKRVNPSFSFQQIISELNKKDQFWWYVDYSGARPLFVLDFESVIYKSTGRRLFKDVDLLVNFDVNRMYSKVSLGSGAFKERTDDDDCSTAAYFEQMPWYGCKDEEWSIDIKSNIDRALDLKGTWSVSSNLIAAHALTDFEDNLDDIFLIHCTYDPELFYLEAKQVEVYTGTWIYNYELMNHRVASRFITGIPGSIKVPKSENVGQVKAVKSANTPYTNLVMLTATVFNPIQFDDDSVSGEDPDNNWGNGTTSGDQVSEANSRFTAPYDGVFNFTLHLKVRVEEGMLYDFPTKLWQDIDLEAGFYLYDSLGAQINVYDTLENLKDAYTKEITVQKQIYMQAGQYIQCGLRATSTEATLSSLHPFRIDAGSYFVANSLYNVTGDLWKYDPDSYPVAKTKFSTFLAKSEFKILERDQFELVQAAGPLNCKSIGKVSDIKYDLLTGEITMSILSKNSQLS